MKNSGGSRALKYLAAGFIILLFLFLNAPGITFFFRDPDQGAQLAKATAILNGHHPFIHIKGNIYGPLVFYMSAVGQFFSGNRLLGEIVLLIGGYSAAYLILFFLMEKISGKFFTSLLLLVAALTMLPRFYKYYIVLGPALFLVAVYHYIQDKDRLRYLVFLSITVGINILYRFDFGAYALITGTILIVILNKKREFRELARILIKFFLYISAIILPWVFIVIFGSGTLNIFVELFSIVKGIGTGLSLPTPGFNLNEPIYSSYNNFSLLFWLFRILPFFTLSILFLLRKTIENNKKIFMSIVSVYCGLIFIQALHRTSLPHLLQVIPVSFILIAWLIGIFVIKREEVMKFLRIPMLFFLILLLSGWAAFLINGQIYKKYNRKIKHGISDFKFYSARNEELRKRFKRNKNLYVANLINQFTEKDEPVFFAPIESQLYYFSDRQFKVSMGVLGPGRLHGEKEQKEFFKELVDSGTRVLADRPFFTYDKIKERNPRYFYPFLMKNIYSEYKIVARKRDTIFLCSDNRFEKRIKDSKGKFIKNDSEVVEVEEMEIELQVDSLNTFSPEEAPTAVSRNSFLFIKGGLNGDRREVRKKNIYLGLKNETGLYISPFKPIQWRSGNTFSAQIFSSLDQVPSGTYELCLVIRRGQGTVTGNINMQISVL